MNPFILNTENQEFINKNLNSDIATLLLKGTSFSSVKTNEIIEQIEAKKRSQKKLPLWFKTNNIYYPNKLNIEQTSSETTARYKASLIEGNTLIDLTGGFGVDSYFFSKQFKSVTHCDINKNLSSIVKHNYNLLNAKNTKVIHTDGMTYLKNSNKIYDWIYIDPSRRHHNKGKVFFLNDCLPNVPEHLKSLFKYSKNIMVKTAPLLDISVGLKELKHVKNIHIIAVNNEVKELLWILENEFEGHVEIKTINLKKTTNEEFHFLLNEEKNSTSKYSKPLAYLYEPNSAILKAGAFNTISKTLHLLKLHKHTHLYTSKSPLINFPGRFFKIETVVPYNKKELKKLAITKANITTRNFPETVKQIRKKFNIKEGGTIYLFFTTNQLNEKIIMVVSKT